MIKYSAIALFCLLSELLSAQTGPQMADVMRQDGKIYVVIAVLAAIFACIVIFLVAIERRLARLERSINKDAPNKP